MLDHRQAAGVGVVGIRVLAGGALSGVAERHPIASPPPDPIGSANWYNADMQRAQRLMPLVQQGHAGSLAEAAVRFAITHRAMGTILVGMATPAEFEQALAAVNKGPLSQAALDGLATLQRGFAGEARDGLTPRHATSRYGGAADCLDAADIVRPRADRVRNLAHRALGSARA